MITKLLRGLRTFFEWIFLNHKAILIISTFIVFFVAVLKKVALNTSDDDIPTISETWVILLLSELGISAAHAGVQKYISFRNQSSGNAGGTVRETVSGAVSETAGGDVVSNVSTVRVVSPALRDSPKSEDNL